MKKLCLIIITVILVSFVGCKTKYSFMHDKSEIATIEIVKIERVMPPSFKVVAIVEDKENFLEEFSNIACYTKSPPSGLELGEIAIKITYNNDDYQLISFRAQSYCLNGGYNLHAGCYTFDETEFNDLLEKYIELSNNE